MRLCIAVSYQMACLDTYTGPDQKGHCPPTMTPRLSFSNDFVESHHPHPTHQDHQKIPPNISAPSDDFEFSAVTNPSNQTMTAADELFFKGKLLPTLRDELLLDDDDDDVSSFLPPKGLPKWKDFLNLKRSGDGRCSTATNNSQDKMPKLALDDKSHLATTS